MNMGLVFFTYISCHKTSDGLVSCASLFLCLSPFPHLPSFKIWELDCIWYIYCIHVYMHICDNSANSKCVIFQERLLKVFKCYNFLWVQRQHNCSPVASSANCVMTPYLLQVHLQTFISIPITQKCQILSYDTLITNERYVCIKESNIHGPHISVM